VSPPLPQAKQDLALAGGEDPFFGVELVRDAYVERERARAAKLGYDDLVNESFEAETKLYQQTLSPI